MYDKSKMKKTSTGIVGYAINYMVDALQQLTTYKESLNSSKGIQTKVLVASYFQNIASPSARIQSSHRFP